MMTFIRTLLIGAAEVVGVLVGLMMLSGAIAVLIGAGCASCAGAPSAGVGTVLLVGGILFVVPNGLFTRLISRFASLARTILALGRAAVTTLLALGITIPGIRSESESLLSSVALLAVALARPATALLQALEIRKEHRRINSEPTPAGDVLKAAPEE